MRKEDLDRENKKDLADLLKRMGILPSRQGRILIEVTPEATIGKIEATVAYR
jgi:hypothetical protein